MKPRPTRRIVAALSVAAACATLPGCCGLVERSDSARSRAFLGGVVAHHFNGNVDRTASTFSGIHCALLADLDRSADGLASACALYGGR